MNIKDIDPLALAKHLPMMTNETITDDTYQSIDDERSSADAHSL